MSELGFSTERIEARFKGKIARVQMILSIFIEDNESIIDTIDKSVADSNFDEMRLYFHKIKGSALNIDADALAAVSENLENSARDGMAIDSGDYEKFKECLSATVEQARNYCA